MTQLARGLARGLARRRNFHATLPSAPGNDHTYMVTYGHLTQLAIGPFLAREELSAGMVLADQWLRPLAVPCQVTFQL